MANDSDSSALPLLSTVRPLAALGIVAMLAGRAIAPVAGGIGVGLDRTTRLIEIGGGALSQFYALAATVVGFAELLVVSRSRLSPLVRTASIGISGFAILLTLTAAVHRVPAASTAIVAIGAAVVCLLVARVAVRSPFGRPVAYGLGAAGLAALARLVAVALAEVAAGSASERIGSAARVVATATFLLDTALLVIAAAWLTARSRKLASPLVALALIAAIFATRAYVAYGDEGGPFTVLLRRAVDQLITRPAPLVPVQARALVAVLAPALAVACVAARGVLPVLAGGFALVLFATSTPEMPLAALSMLIGAVAVALATQDERALWASLT